MATDIHSQQHEMRLEKTYSSGAEEWFCPACGRRFLMQWPPNYKKIILETGDEYAMHSSGKGGLHMGPIQVCESREQEEEEPVISDELRAAVEEALENVDFDDWSHPPA